MVLDVSLTASLAALPATETEAILAELSVAELVALEHDWESWARSNQLAPEGDWRGWLLMAGRGFGKTRTLVEWVRSNLQPDDRVAIVGPTAGDVRDVLIEGESGILATSPPWMRPEYEPSKRRLTWPSGAMAITYSADEPDRLRGPQHTRAVADEIATWRYPDEAWANLMLGLRLGSNPQWVAATTPKPIRLIRQLLEQDGVVVSRGTTYDNRANLADAFVSEIVRRYEGTRVGRQELMGELLEELEDALWQRRQLDALRVQSAPELERVVVAIDPATTSGEDADETGIIVAGVAADGQGYVLADLTCRTTPDGWARRAVNAYHDWQADRIVAETNQGGEMVELTLRTVDRSIPYRAVHASRGKRTRAEPIAALYEQHRVHHVGTHSALEDEMCMFVPDAVNGADDRVDAAVYALTDLMLNASGVRIRSLG